MAFHQHLVSRDSRIGSRQSENSRLRQGCGELAVHANLLSRNTFVTLVASGSFALWSALSSPSFAENSSVLGRWARSDGATQILVTQNGSALMAVNTWVRDPNGREKVGDTLVLTMKPASGPVLGGQAYDVRRHRSYKMTIKLAGASMTTTGCIFMGILCKSALWTRTN